MPAAQAVVVGNSIGSLACVCAAAANPPSIAGVGLFNCAIGMNSKAPPLPDDAAAYALFFNLIGKPPCHPLRSHPTTTLQPCSSMRSPTCPRPQTHVPTAATPCIRATTPCTLPATPCIRPATPRVAGKPLFTLIDALLRSPLSTLLFDKVRTPETVRSLLEGGVYQNAARVDDELVRMLSRPAEDAGALETFVDILTGEPGPRPESLVPLISAQTPIACWWGPEDQVTPLIGVVGQFFRRLPAERASAEFTLLPGTGHCPFDDRPDLASPALIAWLDREWPAA